MVNTKQPVAKEEPVAQEEESAFLPGKQPQDVYLDYFRITDTEEATQWVTKL